MARPAGAKQIARQPDGEHAEFTAAQRRVYGAGLEDRAGWLLRFAALDVPNLREPQRAAIQWDASAFAYYFDKVVISAATFPASPPAWKAVCTAHFLCGQLLGKFRRGQPVNVEVSRWRAVVGMNDGLILGQVLIWELEFPEAFLAQAYEVLTALGRDTIRLRFCVREKCGRPFLTRKTLKTHCSPTCTQAELTRRYRESKRERFRELRRKAYAQAVRKVHPNATVQRQKSHVKT
jgi:hypothetical protein